VTQGTPGYVTLRVGLGTAFGATVVLTSLLLGSLTFFSVRSFIRQGVRIRLGDVAAVGALSLDPGLHAAIRTGEDEDSAAYGRLKEALQRIRRSSADIRYAYTFRRDGEGRIVFVVDAEEDPAEVSHVGEVYEDPSPEMLAVFGRPYQVRTEREFTSDRWGTWLSSYAPLVAADGTLEAVLGIDMSAADVLAYERRYLSLSVLTSVLVCLLVLGVGIGFSRGISRPLLSLAEDMGRVQRFDLSGRIAQDSRIREVHQMKVALANMKTGLLSFRRYVPADLVAELLRHREEAVLSAESRELTIFFADIAGFTTIAEGMPPDRLVRHLGEYLEEMTKAILATGGTVDKYIGDSVMAFWGAPSPLADHARGACAAALECQRRIALLAVRWREAGLPHLATRIGINTGPVIVGNVGYPERLNYTVIGDNVNLASRLESLNKYYGTGVIISDSCRAAVEDGFICRKLDTVVVKGKTRGVSIHELLGERAGAGGALLAAAEAHDEAMERYLGRQWDAAAGLLGEVLRLRPGDRPAGILLDRCRKYAVEAPPDDWQGVVFMREK
jgi:adenylate cyclase